MCLFVYLGLLFFFLVSQLQTELDNLMQQLIFTQEVSQDLRSDMKVVRNATRKVGNEKIQAEEQKLKQVENRGEADEKHQITFPIFLLIGECFIWQIPNPPQDVYVERLTKDIERLTQQIAMYEAQSSAQAEETLSAKEALTEVSTRQEATL